VVLRAWLDPDETVVPVEDLYPPGQSAQQTDQQNQQEMTDSQTSATAAALAELDIPVTVTVAGVAKGVPAAAVLRAGDVLAAVQGRAVTGYASLRAAISDVAPGQPVSVRLRRAGAERTVDMRTTKDDAGRTILGVIPGFAFPFSVKIQISNVVGPSAGTMFALGIIDKLTKLDLTGGTFIAGTGEIEASGKVDPIGGIQQKMVGARDSGATVFLTPADNCAEAVKAIPDGLTLVKVGTLHEAVQAIDEIRTGSGSAPSCSAG
jgi:Lon-like protease